MPPKRIDKIEKLANVYFLYGDEELLAEEALKRLKDLVAAQVDADFNIETLDTGEADAERIIDTAETVPLMSARRLVIVRDADKLPRKEQDKLAAYLDAPNPETTLVLVAHFPQPHEARDSGTAKKAEGSVLFKKSREAGEVLKFAFPSRGKQEKLDVWVRERFKKRGKKAEPEARALVLEKVGRELRDLEDAIERICLYAGDAEAITPEHVERVVTPVAEKGVFELVDAVADRRRDISLYLFNRLMRQGESPQRVFGLLLRQFRLIARVKALSPDHDSRSIASEVGIPPFLVGKCLGQSKRFSSDRLRSIFLEFKRAQVELHSTKYLGEGEYQSAVIEMLITRVIG